MVIRRRYPLILLVISFLAVSGLVAAVNVGIAGPASADPNITLCLTNAPAFCADVKDSNNTSGTPIWLYRPKDGAKDYHWVVEPLDCTDATCLCPEEDCVEFEDAQNTNLCLAVTAGNTGISLIGCELAHEQGGTGRAAWYSLGGNNWANQSLGVNGLLTVSGPLADGRYLYPGHHVSPGGNVWQQWSES
jgi:hypothetical protein